jgi:hypothetical protein
MHSWPLQSAPLRREPLCSSVVPAAPRGRKAQVEYSDSEEEGELDSTTERKLGTRKNPQRQRRLPKSFVRGMKVDPCQIDFGLETGADTDADGMLASRSKKNKKSSASKKKGRK